jgi:hypothetical protein
MKLLVIVPCGRSKAWDKHPELKGVKASEAYIGVPFRINKAFAEKFADKWMVLSAKHGFIEPDFIIPQDYDVSFSKPQTNPISLSRLKQQAEEKALGQYDIVITLGGKNYVNIVKEVFKGTRVIAPTEGLPIGLAMQHVRFLTKLDKEQMITKLT